MAIDPQILQHRDWLGLLQPVGLVVSPVALVKAQAVIDRSVAVALQPKLQAVMSGDLLTDGSPWVPDFQQFVVDVLGWLPEDLVLEDALPEDLSLVLPEYGLVVRPSYGVKDPDSGEWILLIQQVEPGQDLDGYPEDGLKQGWRATVEERFERLLRQVQIPAGILWNGRSLRLVYAPRGESSGHVTFPIAAMTEVAGRPILAALQTVLGGDRLFNVPSDRRLARILEQSRAYQAEVSEKLADQVVDALWEFLRGFQMADVAADGKLLFGLDSGHLYGGLITTLMRLVFLLYAEDEGLMPGDAVYQRYYSVSGLYEQLREDVGNYPDTMDDRFGAWAGLLSLFRLVYEGGGPTVDYLPARHGQLFDPVEFVFLEGRDFGIPRIPDGVIYRMLDKLLMLEGERLSYRALDVEQIGSVYEGIMGYTVERARSLSIGVNSKPKGSKISTTVVIDVAALLVAKAGDRVKLLKEWANCELSGAAAKVVKDAKTVEELVAGLERRLSKRTPNLLPLGSLYLQPTEERRRSGSHYTPRSLSAPIVETTLQPVLAQLGEFPTADQIKSLKVCDLAMGSGAFLVEACRQLAEHLVDAWGREGWGELKGDEPLLLARRQIAQACLYGVDKNIFAVNLAKLSLWLVTLSKDSPFTFLDHALKCGDSLVGLSQKQIIQFGRDPIQDLPLMKYGQEQIVAAAVLRSQIQSSDTRSDEDADLKASQLKEADTKLLQARVQGDVAIAAFFDGKSKKDRTELVMEYSAVVRSQPERMVEIAARLKDREKPIVPFNWEIEFPEVFDQGGFDAIVGNPPFLGGKKLSTNYGDEYLAWILENYPESHGNSDLVAFFFRKAFYLLKNNGVLGLIATNTIAQGDTRKTSLTWICENSGSIYQATKRLKWPGVAAVIVASIHIKKGSHSGQKYLNGKNADFVSAFLFHTGSNRNPNALLGNANKSFLGFKIYGQGFLFDDSDEKSSPISVMNQLIHDDPVSQEIIFPYIGGSEVNSSPTHHHQRYAINFGDMTEDEANKYPSLMEIVKNKVKPERNALKRDSLRIRWWQYGEKQPGLVKAIVQCDRVLVCCLVSKYLSFAFLPNKTVYSHKLNVFAFEKHSAFAILQSRIHEYFAWFFSSTMKDDLNYSPSDCFETFPFPENWETNATLEAVGKTYYEFRAALMIRNNQGLTATYNRFHDPEEIDAEILKLRELHGEMDRVVLNAYGWHDIDTTCEFRLDYEEEDTTSKRKKPWRYRWPEATHDEVLARLLDLNQQRYEQEVVMGGQERRKKKEDGRKKGSKPANSKGKNAKAKTPISETQLALIPEPTQQLDVWSTIEQDAP